MRGIRFKKRWLALVAALAAAAVVVPAALALTFTGSIDGSEPTQTGRLNRNVLDSTCAAPKTNPGLITATGERHYDLYEFANTSGSTQCVTVSYVATAGPCNVFMPAYDGSFNPANPAENWLADGGDSAVFAIGNTVTYSFEVASGGHFVIVAHEVDVNTGCAGYRLEVTGTGIVSVDAIEAIGDLRELIAGMDIHHGIANALDAKLRAALAALEADDTAGACVVMQDFLNLVSAQTGKKLTEEQAGDLTAAADEIREQLGCNAT